jgi:hypothetical protein
MKADTIFIAVTTVELAVSKVKKLSDAEAWEWIGGPNDSRKQLRSCPARIGR